MNSIKKGEIQGLLYGCVLFGGFGLYRREQGKTVFYYIATNAPHGPLNVPKKYLDMYKGNNALEEQFQRFYGMITNIDDNFKVLEEKLDALDLTDNIILIFTTDNGTVGGNKVYDAGLRGAKGSEYERGHRVPLFIRWPDGQLTGGKDIDKLVAQYDLLPTFVDLLGFDFDPVKPLDGTSLKPLLYDKDENWPNRTGPQVQRRLLEDGKSNLSRMAIIK